MFLFVVFVEVLRGSSVHAIPSAEVGQRGAMEHGTSYRLVELAPVHRTLFTPPSQPQARTPDNNVSIEWQLLPMPTREGFEEMRHMFAIITEFFVMFAEKFYATEVKHLTVCLCVCPSVFSKEWCASVRLSVHLFMFI